MRPNAGLDLLAALRLEDDGRRWGELAALFQWEDARAVLDPDSRTPYNFLTRGRGGSKTTDLAGHVLAAMATQLPDASRCYAIAVDREQGRIFVDAIDGFIRRTPALASEFEIGAWRVTHLRTGSTLDVLAADAAGVWGLRPQFVVVDELAQWGTTSTPRRIWEGVSSAAAKLKGARLVVLTTAGDPAHWSYKILQHARADPLWRVNEVPGPAPWLDPGRLAEQRRRLVDSSYRRLFLNEWVAPEDRLASPEDLAACVTHSGALAPAEGRRYAIGVDLGVTRDRTAAAIAHAERVEGSESSRVILDRLQVWAGSRERPVRLQDVEDWICYAVGEFNRALVVLDPWQAIGMAQRLRGRGVRVIEFAFTAQSVGRLASTLHLLLRDGLLSLPDDAGLLEELADVRLRETSPGVLRIDHDADGHDDRAVALALAAQHLIERASRGPRVLRRAALGYSGGGEWDEFVAETRSLASSAPGGL